MDAWRYFTIGEGVALLFVSGISVVDAFRYAWPERLRYGITLRWIGRFCMVLFITIFEWSRLGRADLNWFTPVASVAFTCTLLGVWVSRNQDFMWHDRKEPL